MEAKLSDRSIKQMIAEYVDGGTSQRALAERYKVSLGTISKILSDEKVEQKCTLKKKENEQSMLQYLDSRKDKAQELIEEILSTTKESIAQASLKEKMGALKILSEVFTPNRKEEGAAESDVQINVIEDDF